MKKIGLMWDARDTRPLDSPLSIAVKYRSRKNGYQKTTVYLSSFFPLLYQRKIKTESGALNDRGSCAGPWFEA